MIPRIEAVIIAFEGNFEKTSSAVTFIQRYSDLTRWGEKRGYCIMILIK
jgi:hypothetical protein